MDNMFDEKITAEKLVNWICFQWRYKKITAKEEIKKLLTKAELKSEQVKM